VTPTNSTIFSSIVAPSSGDVTLREGEVRSTAGEFDVTVVVEAGAAAVVAVVVVGTGVVVVVEDDGSTTLGSTTSAKPTAEPRIKAAATQAGRNTAANRRPGRGLEVLSASKRGAPSTEALRFSAALRARSSSSRLIEPSPD
jgi:hypothetical protein